MTPELHRPWFSHYEPSVPRTVTVFDQPLYSLLDEAAARYPKRPALIFQNTRLSYKALHEAAERFAGALRRAGIRPGQRVAVMLPNLPQTMIAFWGVVKCGAVAVMVNPLYMERELLQNLNDAGAECLSCWTCSGPAWRRCVTVCPSRPMWSPASPTPFPSR